MKRILIGILLIVTTFKFLGEAAAAAIAYKNSIVKQVAQEEESEQEKQEKNYSKRGVEDIYYDIQEYSLSQTAVILSYFTNCSNPYFSLNHRPNTPPPDLAIS